MKIELNFNRFDKDIASVSIDVDGFKKDGVEYYSHFYEKKQWKEYLNPLLDAILEADSYAHREEIERYIVEY